MQKCSECYAFLQFLVPLTLIVGAIAISEFIKMRRILQELDEREIFQGAEPTWFWKASLFIYRKFSRSHASK